MLLNKHFVWGGSTFADMFYGSLRKCLLRFENNRNPFQYIIQQIKSLKHRQNAKYKHPHFENTPEILTPDQTK